LRVFGYARVSTADQVKSGSFEQQREDIRRYCEAHGHELVRLYGDAGWSALGERPEWSELMETLQGRIDERIEAVVVTKLDRWGRSVQELITSINDLKEKDVAFVSIGDSLDTSTANGRLLFHILSAFAEFEREIIRERLAAGRERAKAAGKQMHRPRLELDNARIKHLYTELPLSATVIGKLMKVSTGTILSRLREMGVKIK